MDALLEDGFEKGGPDTTSELVVNSIYLETVLRRLREEDPVYLNIVCLRADGLTLNEISQQLSIPRTKLHRMLQKIRVITESVGQTLHALCPHVQFPVSPTRGVVSELNCTPSSRQ